MVLAYRYLLAVGLVFGNSISAFSTVAQTTKRTTGLFSGASNADAAMESFPEDTMMPESSCQSVSALSRASSSRRQVLKGAITTTVAAATATPVFLSSALPSFAAEDKRCDAADPRCGADGVLRDTRPRGQPIPRVTNKITHVVQLYIDVGERREEIGVLRLGLYGEDCPKTVRTMLEFVTPIGITGVVDQKKVEFLENSIGLQTLPVSILQGGIVPDICPGNGIEFGVVSQKKAYARARGLPKAGDDFLPQNRPEGVSLESEPSARKHDMAGLVSVPEMGIGYASGGDVDGAYASAFLVTADDNSELMDTKLRRRVIGQVIDDESMAFLARLSSLPIQKKGSGSRGPPLLKVTVLDTGVQKVGAAPAPPSKGKKKK